MKNKYLFTVFAAGSMLLAGFQHTHTYSIERYNKQHSHIADADGPSAGKTGAPGESNCTSCHNGAAQDGSSVNTVVLTQGATVVSGYTPGGVYNVAVAMSTFSGINGFQIVALNSSNAQAGTISILPSSGTQLKNGSAGKKYVTHTLAGNVQHAWAFQWTAPASDVGTVTFYLATNKTNESNSDSGDIIYLSQHPFGSTAGIEEQSVGISMEIGYVKLSNSISLNYNSLKAGESSVNITDISGKSVLSESIGATEVGQNQKMVKLPSEVKSGVYIVHLNVNNTFVSKKVFIQ